MNRALSLIVLVVLTPDGHAQTESYRIKIKDVAQGLKRQNEVIEQTKTLHKVIGPKNQVLVNRSHSISTHALYHEVILKHTAGKQKPEQLQRYYYKATSGINGKQEVLPYQKKYVLIARSNKGPFVFQIEKQGQLTGAAAHLLHKEFNAHKAFDLQRMVLPDKQVRVNETWRLDIKDIASNWEKGTKMSVDLRRSTGVGKLVKVYTKEKHLFGVLQFHIEMPLLTLGEGKARAQMKTGSKMVMDVTLDACIDGHLSTGTLQGSFKVSASATVPSKKGGQARMQLDVEGSIQKSRKELVK